MSEVDLIFRPLTISIISGADESSRFMLRFMLASAILSFCFDSPAVGAYETIVSLNSFSYIAEKSIEAIRNLLRICFLVTIIVNFVNLNFAFFLSI